MPTLAKRRTRLPQLERETPLVAIAVARQVVEEVARYIDQPVPARYATRLVHRARAIYANSDSFRARIKSPGDVGRDWLYLYMRHWFAAILKDERPDLFDWLPRNYASGKALPEIPRRPQSVGQAILSPEAHLLLC